MLILTTHKTIKNTTGVNLSIQGKDFQGLPIDKIQSICTELSNNWRTHVIEFEDIKSREYRVIKDLANVVISNEINRPTIRETLRVIEKDKEKTENIADDLVKLMSESIGKL